MSLELRPIVPALIVAVTGLVVLLTQAFTPRGGRPPSALLSLIGLVGALVATLRIAAGNGRGSVLGNSVVADDFSLFFHVLLLGIAILVVLLSPGYLRATGADRGEYYALLLFSLVGMLGLVSTLELISLFVALEIMSVALYAMAGLHRDRVESQEAAVKYFITGAFSSAFFLYGVALLYGVSGSTSLGRIASAVSYGAGGSGSLATLGAFSSAFFLYGVALLYGVSGSTSLGRIASAVSYGAGGGGSLAILGAGLLLVGFGFKIASVPFHMWAPDVYEGAPTTVTAFMAAGVKAAAFGALLRVFGGALAGSAYEWQPAVAVLATVSMVIGNLGALAQTNVKRLLAWSSVAHAGYLLTALVAKPGVAAEAVLFYLVGYAAVNLGGFGAIAALARDGREPLSLNDFAGLGDRRPALAAALTVFLISLTGVPVSAGFVGKFYLFSAAVGAGHTVLAIVGVLMSVVSAYYYLRIVVAMYMREPEGDDTWGPIGVGPALALAVSTAIALGLGIYPGPILAFARQAAAAL